MVTSSSARVTSLIFDARLYKRHATPIPIHMMMLISISISISINDDASWCGVGVDDDVDDKGFEEALHLIFDTL